MSTSAPQAAKPTKSLFDPFNSSATGHQRADSRLSSSTSWRDSRTSKLREQFSAGSGGGKRLHDTVGAGSLDFGVDGRTENGGWTRGAKGLRADGQASLQEAWNIRKEAELERGPARKKVKVDENALSTVVSPFTPFRRRDGTVRESSWPDHHTQQSQDSSPGDLLSPITRSTQSQSSPTTEPGPIAQEPGQLVFQEKLVIHEKPQIFTSCCVYLNGSTAPLISDHKLKHLLSIHGATMSVAFGRRTVTHVILGNPSSKGGSGGGLAGSKIQKEIETVRGKGVKFVTVSWVLDSIEAGKRLPEGRFTALELAVKGQGSVASMFVRVPVDKGDGK
ncbi:hypothetical protein K431DRAFT_303851 [Polychaeton citri CBS 116435]|uniref:BRCT domain-containing protein n=1 Tax=Polychaeton citri CBS 116435 TaxID=1314669 RepID=A0A9P4QAC2_9PEZI|nr:hypothetical protein K431DRAFT_303851 [Polychaeton citri CBS 116435]